MGSDIEGWFEILRPDWRDDDFPLWVGIVRIDRLVERNYAMFSNLFGHRDAWGFTPIAANRGFSANVSDEVDYQWLDRRGGEQTWIG
jgi:hypothetical protein